MLRRTFLIDNTETFGEGTPEESIRIAISTETPYLRGRINGHKAAYEVLGHRSNEVNMEYLIDGAPFLFEHKVDNQIGVLENVQVNQDGILRADVRFSDLPFAQAILSDIKRGIRKRISVGYEVKAYEDVGDMDGTPVVRATSWTPYEASLVSIPADLNAGVGKGLRGKRQGDNGPVFVYNDANEVVEVILPDGTAVTDPTEVANLVAEFSAAPAEPAAPAVVTTTTVELPDGIEMPTVDDVNTSLSPLEDTMEPATEEESIQDDLNDAVAEAVVEVLSEAGLAVGADSTEEEDPAEMDVMSASTSKALFIQTETHPAPAAAHKETSKMSDKSSNGSTGAESKETVKELTALAVRHNMTDDLADWISEGKSVESVKALILDTRANDKTIVGAPAIHTKSTPTFGSAVSSFLKGENSELAERGLDQARASGRSINSNTLYIPTNVDMIPVSVRTGTGYTNTGANAVGKVYMSWEDALREGSKLSAVGGQILTLNDIGSMPYFSAPTTASMYHESGSSNDKEVTIALRTWAPHRVSARYLFQNVMSRLNGTYDFESALYQDLLMEGVRQIDSQVWNGTGTAPAVTGLINQSDIPSITTSGSFDLAGAANMWSTVAANNGVTDGNFKIVVATTPYGHALASASFGNGSGISALAQIEGTVGKVFNTNYFSTLSNGTLYSAIGGDFSKVTLANFGALEIKRDEYTLSQTGQTVLQLEAYIDSVARQPGALVRWSVITG